VKSLAPDEFINAILKAPVDLLWNGGIGTYVKASTQTHAEVGDRANDYVRVDASEMRCKVVAEGGNLGVTEAGRVEFAQSGGRIGSDAIDNSAGVDCSDHEVNLKILLSRIEANGDITRKQRNDLLHSMADEVCAHVLTNNYAQNETLSTALGQAPGMLQVHQRLMVWLEEEADLDREAEALPSDPEIAERRTEGLGLTRPELAVLLAYTKNLITHHLVVSDLPHDSSFDEILSDYFPEPIRERYPDLIQQHPLRAELLATLISNDVVNRGGISMAHRLKQETSATLPDIARAHLAAWKIYDLDPLWRAVRELDGTVPAAIQTVLDLEIKRLGERASRWLLRNEPQPIVNATVTERYGEAVRSLHRQAAAGSLAPNLAASVDRYVAEGVPLMLARQVASLGPAFGFLDLSRVAARTEIEHDQVAALHAVLEDRLDLTWLRDQIIGLPRADHWETMARSALRDEYFREHAELTSVVLEAAKQRGNVTLPPDVIADAWLKTNAVPAQRCRRTFKELKKAGNQDLAHASVALRALSQLRRTT